MSNLKRLVPPVGTILSVSEFAAHVRVGSPDIAEETPELQRALEAATTMLERRLSLAFLEQGWEWSVKNWRSVTLPLRPVQSIESITIVNAQGDETVWDAQYWRLDQNSILAFGMLPTIPHKGSAKINFTAGFDSIPENLTQAVLVLAAYLYQHRDAQALEKMPYQVESLIAPYKSLRLGGAVCL